MITSVFLAICAIGAAASLALGGERWLGTGTALTGLVLAFLAALAIGSAETVSVGGVTLAGTEYAGTFLAIVAAAAFGLTLVTALSGGPVRAAPAALAALGGMGLAMTAVDAPLALAGAAIAAAAAAAGSVVGRPSDDAGDGRTSEARTMALLVGGLLFAGLALARPAWAGDDGPVLALGLLGLGTALAVRSGAVPFHVPAARLGGRGASPTAALLTVWLPAGLGLVAVSWSAATFTNDSDWIGLVAVGLRLVAVTTIVLGGIGALLHDAPSEIAIYSIVADSGFVLLALAARSDPAAVPAREWLLVFVGSKTALVAWAAAMSATYGASGLSGMRGWLRRAPLPGIALVAAAVAGIGWPGSMAFEARAKLVELGLPGALQLVAPLAILLAAACWIRVLAIGVLPPSGAHVGTRGRWSPRPSDGRSETDAQIPAEEGAVAVARRPGSSVSIDRSLAAGGAVAAGALLALALTAGIFATGSSSGIPLDVAAHASPTSPPTPTPTATAAVPTLAPHGTLIPSFNFPTPTPKVSATPTRSAAPPTIPQQ
jgi:formate hydrogenlyase subunit 3/multisubunit Na+/H+ antiporter MnhD subunit